MNKQDITKIITWWSKEGNYLRNTRIKLININEEIKELEGKKLNKFQNALKEFIHSIMNYFDSIKIRYKYTIYTALEEELNSFNAKTFLDEKDLEKFRKSIDNLRIYDNSE